MVQENNPACTGELFNKLNTLRVIFLLDIGVIRECGVFRWVIVELEPRRIEHRNRLISTEALKLYIMGLEGEVSIPYPDFCLEMQIFYSR